MMTELCAELHNYFCVDADKHFDVFKISDGKLTPSDFILDGQYFRIIGSVFNDGVYKFTDGLTLIDEEFDGAVWCMRVPITVLDLADDIKEWCEKYGEQASSPFTNESFGGYSYTKSTGGTSSTAGTTWQGAFAGKLKVWRKL